MGSRQFWQGCQPWPQAFPKGRSIRPLPSRERGEPQTLKKPYSTLTEASITHSRTGNQFPHVGHATDFSSAIHPPSSHARFLQSVYILPWLEIILAMPNRLRRDHNFLSDCWAVFLTHVEPRMLREVNFGHRVVIPHSPLSILAPRMFFIHGQNLQLRGMFLLLGMN